MNTEELHQTPEIYLLKHSFWAASKTLFDKFLAVHLGQKMPCLQTVAMTNDQLARTRKKQALKKSRPVKILETHTIENLNLMRFDFLFHCQTKV